MDILLLICILLNVSIGVIFKYFSLCNVDAMQAVVINYFTCTITATMVIGNTDYLAQIFSKDWSLYALAMGALFFVVFNAIAISIKYQGVVITSAFQRLSLLAPVAVSILFFKETINWKIWIGILTSIVSILILNSDALKDKKKRSSHWLLPVLVWAGSCLVDLSLYLVERLKLANGENMEFTSSLFLSAACFGTLVLLYKLYTREKTISVKSLMSGVFLGVPNFFSIYLILVLLERGWNGSVLFPILNVTAILGSGIIGYLIFQEKLNLIKIIGFILVVISVILLS